MSFQFQVTHWIVGLMFFIHATQSITCPDGQHEIGETCVWLSSDEASWFQAREKCREDGGDLAVIQNAEMNIAFYRAVARFGDYTTNFWIGLNDLATEGSHRWLDDESEATFTYWERWRYDHVQLDCVAVYGSLNQRWRSSVCGQKFRYACQNPPASFLRKCPPGSFYNPNEETCISLSETQASWTNARASCQQEGGDLAVIENEKKNALVIALVFPVEVRPYYIGLHDDGSGYHWLEQTVNAVFRYWRSRNKPGMSDGCAVIQLTEETRPWPYWFARDCQEQNYYICETAVSDITPVVPEENGPN